ncbi:MAG: hypothetical protein ACLSF2_08975 [Butyricicoccus sp.]
MKVFSEPGVLSRSERFFSTPSATARRLFYYVTRVGHYYYDARYNFLDSCDIAHLESHKNLFLTYVRSGTMYFETDQLYCAERGQIGLVDCRRPHHFYTKGDAEALWIHFDGANAAAFFEQIPRSAAAGRCLRRRRIYASSRSWHRSFPACAPAT